MQDLDFPSVGILPRQETGALQFLQRNPECDGRGVVVAILDTGCDPTAEGLTLTPDGQPKFIDVVDATGSGDVDTSKVVKADDDGVITGLTGRKLRPGKDWTNPSGEWRIGILPAYNVVPSPAKKRVETRRAERFQERQDKALANLRLAIAAQEKHVTSDAVQKMEKEEKKAEQEKLEDLKTTLSQIEGSSNASCGPVFDLVVWNDGNEWVAVLETSTAAPYFRCEEGAEVKSDEDRKGEDGVIDLSDLKPMTNFRVRQDVGIISEEDMLSFVLNIYDGGDVVSVVTPGGSHGSHVAGIVGAYFPKDASRNGVAPGCQMVSIKIGDTRLGSMETNQGLLRAMDAILGNKVDICNMSYGEPTTNPKAGAFAEAVNRLVWKHGVIFVSSAGNDGPCFSTAGAPQAASEAMIGVGAIFSPQMCKMEYGYAELTNALQSYTWTSRGPTLDGAIGVKLCAPGGAIAPIPKYNLSKNQLMNGTSMASPNCAGCVALLLGSLKQKGVAFTPTGVEHVLINTARRVANVDGLAQGYGLVQVPQAVDFALKNPGLAAIPVHWEFKISGNGQTGDRGIYVRNARCERRAVRYSVMVTPKFPDDFPNEEKVNFELMLNLHGSEPFVQPAKHLVMNGRGRSFQVVLDLGSYEAKGTDDRTADFAEIVAIDTKNPDAGPVFRIPVVIATPTAELDADHKCTRVDRFTSATIRRGMYAVPNGASSARISVRCIGSAEDKENSFAFASFFSVGTKPHAFESYFRLSTGTTKSWTILAVPGTLLECTLSQRSLSVGKTEVEWTVQFCGPAVGVDTVYANSADGFSTVDVCAKQFRTKLKPQLKFKTFSRFYGPASADIVPLSQDRGNSTVDGALVYGLELGYNFDQEIAGSCRIRFPRVDRMLYESVFEGCFFQVFDANRKYVGSGEAFDHEVTLKKQAGYRCVVQLRHASVATLEKCKTLQMRIDSTLSKELSGSAFGNQRDVITGSKFGTKLLQPGDQTTIYVQAQFTDKELPVKSLQAGDQLQGWLSLCDEKDSLEPKFRKVGATGETGRSVPVVCQLTKPVAVPKNEKKAANNGAKDEEEKPTVQQKHRDAMIKFIAGLQGAEQQEAFASIGEELLGKEPENLQLLQLRLHVRDGDPARKEKLAGVIDAADAVAKQVNQTDLAAHFGRKPIDADAPEYKRADKKAKEEKEILIDALRRKVVALRDQAVAESESKDAEEKKDASVFAPPAATKEAVDRVDAAFKELQSWTDVAKDKKNKDEIFKLRVWILHQKGRVGEVLKLVNEYVKANAEEGGKPLSKAIAGLKVQAMKAYLSDDFAHVIAQSELQLILDYPDTYRLF